MEYLKQAREGARIYPAGKLYCNFAPLQTGDFAVRTQYLAPTLACILSYNG